MAWLSLTELSKCQWHGVGLVQVLCAQMIQTEYSALCMLVACQWKSSQKQCLQTFSRTLERYVCVRTSRCVLLRTSETTCVNTIHCTFECAMVLSCSSTLGSQSPVLFALISWSCCQQVLAVRKSGRFAWVEFTSIQAAHQALTLDGELLGSNMLKISQSKTPIHTAGWRAPVCHAKSGFSDQFSFDSGEMRDMNCMPVYHHCYIMLYTCTQLPSANVQC